MSENVLFSGHFFYFSVSLRFDFVAQPPQAVDKRGQRKDKQRVE